MYSELRSWNIHSFFPTASSRESRGQWLRGEVDTGRYDRVNTRRQTTIHHSKNDIPQYWQWYLQYVEPYFFQRANMLLLLHHNLSWTDSYHLSNVQSSCVGLSADGPEKAVHLLDGTDLLLLVLLLWIFGDECHLQASVCFTHRLHLRVLPQIYTGVLKFFGAVWADEGVKVPQNLQREYKSVTVWFMKNGVSGLCCDFVCFFLTPVCRIIRDVFDPRVERMPAISTAI